MKHPVLIAVGAAVVSAGVAAHLFESARDREQIERRLTAMERALSAADRRPAACVTTQAAPAIALQTTAAAGLARKRQNLELILSSGWRLVENRTPESAATAAQIFREGIASVDARNPDLYNGLGRALLVAGDPRGAIRAWETGLTLAPTQSEMQSGIGWAYWSMNDPRRAKEAWQKALAINQRSVDAWSAMAWIDLAQGKITAAKQGFQELVQFDPKRLPWLTGLSMARARNTSFEEISHLFKLPPLDAFEAPLSPDPT